MNIFLIKKERKAIIGALVGNIVEFYDFMVFVFLLRYIVANFFPNDLESIATLKALTVSMVAYFVRPVGALFFGGIGDIKGRKKALMLSILMASAATVSIGLLPTFSRVGFFSPVLLLSFRALQGFSVSGEQGSAAVFLRELLGKENSCFAGSLVVSSIFLGIVFGSAICYVFSLLISEKEMFLWGWRIPFLFAAPLGVISFWFRVSTKESPVFVEMQKNNKTSKYPTKDLFTCYWKELLLLIIVGSVYAATTSIYMVFVPNYLSLQKIISYTSSMLLISLGMLFMSIFIPVVGMVADKIKLNNLIKIGAIVSCVLAAPSIHNVFSGEQTKIFIGQVGFIIMISIIAAPIFSVIVDTFPAKVRCVGASFVFNTSITMFSALTPAIAFMLVNATKNQILPSLCIIIPSVMCYIGYECLYIRIK